MDILIFYHPQKVLRGFKLPKWNNRWTLKDALLEEWSLTVSLKYCLPLMHLQSQAVFPFKGPHYGKRPRLNAQFHYSVMSPQPNSQHSTWRGCVFLTTPQTNKQKKKTNLNFIYFWPHCTACGIAAPWPGIKLGPWQWESESQPLGHQETPLCILPWWVYCKLCVSIILKYYQIHLSLFNYPILPLFTNIPVKSHFKNCQHQQWGTQKEPSEIVELWSLKPVAKEEMNVEVINQITSLLHFCIRIKYKGPHRRVREMANRNLTILPFPTPQT